jgi:streptogramin lyase
MLILGATGIRSSRSDTRKRTSGRVFWAEAPENRQLEPRLLLSLTYTNFFIPLVEVVRPQGITTGPDGNLWFTENVANRIGRETPGGSLSEFALPANVISPGAITPGSDGNIWFTAVQEAADESVESPVLGKITTAGMVSIDSLPAADYEPLTGLAAGPDGALWFTGLTGTVGRMTTAGVESEFPVPEVPPPSNSPAGTGNVQPDPLAITAGSDGKLWIISDNSRIWSVTTAGVFTGYQVAGLGGEAAITTGPDGALWFTGLGENLGRITTAGVESKLAITGFTPGSAIVTGPDGNLWFYGSPTQDLSEEEVARMTPAGAATYFDVTGNFSSIGGLTKGPDGNVWFTEQEDGSTAGQQPAVARITPGGVVTTYAIPPRMTLDPGQGVPIDPTAITVGPDGALWFTEGGPLSGAGKIGRITTDGTLSEFALPDPQAATVAITVGPDGTLWFTQDNIYISNNDSQTWSIGRITTAGVITVFPLPAGASPQNITKGRDGNLWFTEDFTDPVTLVASGVIGRITPQGGITTFTVPLLNAAHYGQVGAITSGPDGNLWFTGVYLDKNRNVRQCIGQITIRGKVQVFSLPSSPSTYADSLPSPLISGPDGKLWFDGTVHGIPGIARISTKGEFGKTIPTGLEGGIFRGPNGQVWFPTVVPGISYGLSTATRSGIVVARDLPAQYVGYYTVNINGMAAGPDGNLWFTSGSSEIVRISGLDSVAGGLDYRHRPKQVPDYDSSNDVWTNTTRETHPVFAGVARPGALVTLSVQRQGDSQVVVIGHAHASKHDGAWTLKSAKKLKDGSYAVIATQSRDSSPPTVLYPLQADASGNGPTPLIIDTSAQVKKPVTKVRAAPSAILARQFAKRSSLPSRSR